VTYLLVHYENPPLAFEFLIQVKTHRCHFFDVSLLVVYVELVVGEMVPNQAEQKMQLHHLPIQKLNFHYKNVLDGVPHIPFSYYDEMSIRRYLDWMQNSMELSYSWMAVDLH
jgi:hypothetical protein